MLLSLPVPGTPAFFTLGQGLRPYGISPSGISLNAPTSRFSDVILEISLLDGRIRLRLSYGWFELTTEDLYEQDEVTLINIVEVLLSVLDGIEAGIHQGRARIDYAVHLILPPSESEGLLQEHLHGGEVSPNIIPYAFAYNLTWNDDLVVQTPSMVVSRSLLFPEGLLVNFSIEYKRTDEPARMRDQISKDHRQALALIGLEITTTSDNKDNV